MADEVSVSAARRALITVGIATRNRPDSLMRCLRSLERISDYIVEVIAFDDGSQPPLETRVRRAMGGAMPAVRFIRTEASRGPTAARNRFVREARTECVLSLDDDTTIISSQAIHDALEVMRQDAEVAIIAFAQTDEYGNCYAEQTAPVDYSCYVPAFIGFAHLIRRKPFLDIGGYREQIDQNGEEKELTLRLLDRGSRVVYLPRARVAHLADPRGRNSRRYLHQVVRNDALFALYNEPWPIALLSVPLRLLRYFPMRRGWAVEDPGGFTMILRGLSAVLPRALRDRQPVRWETIRRWRALGSSFPAYSPPRGQP